MNQYIVTVENPSGIRFPSIQELFVRAESKNQAWVKVLEYVSDPEQIVDVAESCEQF